SLYPSFPGKKMKGQTGSYRLLQLELYKPHSSLEQLLSRACTAVYFVVLFLFKYNRSHSNSHVILWFRIFVSESYRCFTFPNKYQLAKLICFYVLIWWWII